MIKTFVLVLSLIVPGFAPQSVRQELPSLDDCFAKAAELMKIAPEVEHPQYLVGAACFVVVNKGEPV